MRDYLGSVRAFYDITPDPEDVTSAGSQFLEQNDYYAFGERINNPSLATSAANRYRYNGKEQLRFEGINLDNDDWIEYDKQINNTPYKLILQRQ